MNKNKRGIKLADYNITGNKYRELKYFCLQYIDKKNQLKNGYGLSAVNNNGMPRGTGQSSQTESSAIRNLRLQQEIELIERTAIEADSRLYPWIIKNVTEGIGYEYLRVPVNRTDFYAVRKYFFYLLSQKR